MNDETLIGENKMITEQEFTQEEIMQRAKENSNFYHNPAEWPWDFNINTFDSFEAEESYWWD